MLYYVPQSSFTPGKRSIRRPFILDQTINTVHTFLLNPLQWHVSDSTWTRFKFQPTTADHHTWKTSTVTAYTIQMNSLWFIQLLCFIGLHKYIKIKISQTGSYHRRTFMFVVASVAMVTITCFEVRCSKLISKIPIA